MKNTFITGSHAYGKPTTGSDLDIAILMGPADAVRLEDTLTDQRRGGGGGTGRSDIMHSSYYLGGRPRVNLLVFTDAEQFEVWRKATEFLKGKAPVTRDQAIKYIRRKLAKAGFIDE